LEETFTWNITVLKGVSRKKSKIKAVTFIEEKDSESSLPISTIGKKINSTRIETALSFSSIAKEAIEAFLSLKAKKLTTLKNKMKTAISIIL